MLPTWAPAMLSDLIWRGRPTFLLIVIAVWNDGIHLYVLLFILHFPPWKRAPWKQGPHLHVQCHIPAPRKVLCLAQRKDLIYLCWIKEKIVRTPQMLLLSAFTLCFRYCGDTEGWKADFRPWVVYRLVEEALRKVERVLAQALPLCCTNRDKPLLGPQLPGARWIYWTNLSP